MKIAAVNFRGLSLWRLHPGGTRTYLIPFALWPRACRKGNSPLQGFPLLVSFQVPPGNVLAMPNYSLMAHLGGLLPSWHLWCSLAFSSPLLPWCSPGTAALRCSAPSEAATQDLETFRGMVRLYTPALLMVTAAVFLNCVAPRIASLCACMHLRSMHN